MTSFTHKMLERTNAALGSMARSFVECALSPGELRPFTATGVPHTRGRLISSERGYRDISPLAALF